jgi:glycosyltransferase involved in cell wall biosynthesis
MKILYFYPENPLVLTQGNNARAKSLLEYFSSRNIELTFVGHQGKHFNNQNINELINEKLVTHGYLLKKFNRKKKQIQYLLQYSIPNKLLKKLTDFDRTRITQKKEFDNILKLNSYDYIIISYAYWASLTKGNKYVKNAKLIIDTHDFLTAQFQNNKNFELGKYFKQEIELINEFDEIIVISAEEKYVFSQFIDKPIHIVAHGLPEKQQETNKTTDIIYVASDNEHNVNAAKWFFEKVYPILPKNIKITVIGKITKHVKESDNVTKIAFIDDLDEAYATSKIAICPMLTGTGLKIKVVEALSFGLPIVCNERGVDGLLNKTKNGCLVTNNEVEFAQYINELLNNEIFYQQISNEAKSFFNETLNQEIVYKNLDKIFIRS